MARKEKYPGLAKWLKTDSGHRFFSTFVRKNFRHLLATSTGDAFVRWLLDQLEKERRAVVVEISHDGQVRVFGDRIDVRVVNLVQTRPSGEALAEELAAAKLRGDHARVYLDARALKAIGCSADCPTVAQLAEAESRRRLAADFSHALKDFMKLVEV